MNIMVTGATGFLGSHVAQGLIKDDHEVSLLVRNPAKLIPDLQQCRIVKGDILDLASIKASLKGAKAVVHCAAYVGEWGPREMYVQTNVQGTRNMIDACAAAGAKRFIHISSNSVYGEGDRDNRDLVEETPYRKNGQFYGDSKVDSERLVFEAHAAGKIAATAIRPSMIWGPRDRQFFPKIIEALSKGLMAYPGGGHKLIGLTHVDNIVDLVRLCLTNKISSGRAYNVDDDDRRTMRDLVQALCARLGYKEPWLSVPTPMAKALAEISEFIGKTMKSQRPPLITKMGIGILCYDNDVSVERAKKELGYHPQDLFEERLDAYLQSYRAGE